jgi:hypothetical protein
MPRIAGVNLLGVLLAGIAVFFIGFIFYGLLFTETWANGLGMYMSADGKEISYLTADGVTTLAAGAGEPIWMIGGFVISLVIAYGIGWHMKQKNISKLPSAVLMALWISLLFGVPLMAYTLVYSPWHDVGAFLVNAGHTVVTFVVAAAVMSLFD